MKKLYFIFTLALIFVGTQVFADVVTTRRRVQPTQNNSSQETNYKPTKTEVKNTPITKKETRLSRNVKNCRRYSESLDSDVSGVAFNFKIDILGWQDDRCIVNFAAKSEGITSMFEAINGIDPSRAKIQIFEPKVRCEFTKQQLERVGDSILQEEERSSNLNVNMLKDPSSITLPKLSELSGSDAALMDVLLNDRACTILNAPDSNAMFNSLFDI